MLVNNTIESSRRPGIPGPHRPDLKWFKDALDGKSDVGHVHQKEDITDFEHTHDGRYYRKDTNELSIILSGNGTPNFNEGKDGDYFIDELNGDLYKKSGDAWNLIIHLEGDQGPAGPQGIQGVRGPEGPIGKEGYTPVRGTDYWTPEDEEIIRQSIVSEVQLGLSGKVDKVEGKGLSTEDFTTLLKLKLEELQNYDDRNIRELLEKALYNVTIDVKTGILTFHTIDESSFTVDLPLELIVSDGYLDNDTNTIVLVLANGNTIDIPVENLVRDFYGKAEVDQKIADLAEEVAIDFEAVAEDFNKVDEELAKAQAQIDALKAENEAQQKELDVLYNDLVPGEASGETAVVSNGVTGSKVEIDGDGNTVQEVIEAVEGTTVVDTNMNLTDVDTTFENSLLPMGNISQETTEGYQLLDLEKYYYYSESNSTLNGVTVKVENGILKMDGTNATATGTAKSRTVLKDSGINTILTPGTYYLGVNLNGYYEDDINTLVQFTIGTKTIEKNYILVQWYYPVGIGEKAERPLIISNNSTKQKYEKYTGGQASPNINYPSPVKGVGGHYTNELRNKNIAIFKNKSTTVFGISSVVKANGKMDCTGTSTASWFDSLSFDYTKFKIGEKYTLYVSENPYVFTLRINYKDGTQQSISSAASNNYRGIFTPTKEIVSAYMYATGFSVGAEIVITDLEIMILKGDYTSEDVGEFIIPESQSLPIDIPVGQTWYSGKPYKLNGKWYRDEKFEKYVFTGDENFSNVQNANNIKYFTVTNLLPNNASETVFCSHFKSVETLWELTEQIDCIKPSNNVLSQINIMAKGYSDSPELKAKLKELYEAGDPVYVIYETTNPRRIEITDETLIEQLEALQNAEFYNGVTNINSYPSSEDVAEMPLEAHYNFITPAPSPDRDSEVEIAEAYNLFEPVESFTTKGITVIKNDDGSLTLIGTPTENFNLNLLKQRFYPKINQDYIINVDVLEGNAPGSLWFWNVTDSNSSITLTPGNISTNPKTFKFTEQKELYPFAITLSKGIYVDCTIRLSLNKGKKLKPYVPFGCIGLLQRTGNLYDYKNVLYQNSGGLNIKYLEDGSVNIKGTVEKSHTQITKQIDVTHFLRDNVRYYISQTEANSNLYIQMQTINRNTSQVGYLNCIDKNIKSFIADTKNNRYLVNIQTGISLTALDVTYKFMLSDLPDTEFVPYYQEIIPINLRGNKLAKLPSGVKDNLLIGLDGKCNIGKKTDSDDLKDAKWFVTADSYDENRKRYATQLLNNKENPIKPNTLMLCNYFKSAIGYDKLFIDNYVTNPQSGAVSFYSSKYSTADDWADFINQNNLYLLYELTKPTTILLPNIEPIELFEGTNIFELITSLPTTLTAHYKVSSKKQLIENNDRITALEATVNTLLGGN